MCIYITIDKVYTRVQQQPTEMTKGLEHLSYKQGLRELRMLSLEKKRCLETLSMSVNTWWEGVKKTESGSSRCCLVTGLEVTGINPPKHKKILFCCEGGQTLKLNVHTGYRVSICGHTQDPWALYSDWPVFEQEGLLWVITRGAFKLQLSCDSR